MQTFNVETTTDAINLGYQGESDATQVVFTIPDDLIEYSVVIYVTRAGETTVYPASQVTVSDGTIVWTITNVETAIAGAGEAQVRFMDGDTLVTTMVYMTVVHESIVVGEDAPDPYETWLDTLTALAAETQQNATSAAASAENAATSETNAETSETNAANSETNAATSEANASASEANASTSATNAAASEANASASATSAATSAANASTSATNASVSETRAAASATESAGSASLASEYASSASSSAESASASATASATSATNAENSKASAGASEVNAAASATSANQSAILARSWAVGGTSSRAGEDTDNAKHYSELAAQSAENAGYAYFSVNENTGEVNVTVSDSLSNEVTFSVDESAGTLEVSIE